MYYNSPPYCGTFLSANHTCFIISLFVNPLCKRYFFIFFFLLVLWFLYLCTWKVWCVLCTFRQRCMQRRDVCIYMCMCIEKTKVTFFLTNMEAWTLLSVLFLLILLSFSFLREKNIISRMECAIYFEHALSAGDDRGAVHAECTSPKTLCAVCDLRRDKSK